MLIEFLVLVFSYFLGTISTAYLVSRFLYGVDIRKIGSGNVGGANVMRAFGWKPFVLVVIGDVGKGVLAVFLAKYVILAGLVDPSLPMIGNPLNLQLLAGFFASLGHSYNVFLKFKGGKAGATSAGALIVVSPASAAIIIVLWILIVWTTRYTSLGNLVLSVLAIIIFMVVNQDPRVGWGVLPYTLLIWWRHRENLKRLLLGTERKFGEKLPNEEIEKAKIVHKDETATKNE